jgi:hypothetical protein
LLFGFGSNKLLIQLLKIFRKIRNMCGRFACGLAPDVVRRLSTYMNTQTQELTLPPFIDLMSSTHPFRASWNISPTSTWYK